MLSSVLRGDRALQVNIAIMRAFVRLREMLGTNADLARKLEEIDKKYDGQFRLVFDAIRQLMAPSSKPAREMGFHTPLTKITASLQASDAQATRPFAAPSFSSANSTRRMAVTQTSSRMP